ncbi:MAG: restriction endonuclease subunit S [Desulfotomaculales bacterium]
MTDGPYKLPEGWRWVRLGEVCLPTERRDPSKNPLTYFMYVDISAIDNTVGKIVSPKEVLGQHAPSRARKVIRAGDVIFATTRPYLKNIALVPPDLDGQICSTGFCVIRANREFAEPEFLFHLCRSDFVTDQLTANKMRGASYPAVTDNDVYNTLIPLPPLEEQRRIAAKVEALMERVREARRLRAEVRKDAERLMQAALAEVFPRPGQDLPEGWSWVRLGEVCEINPKRPKLNREISAPTSFVPMTAVDEISGTITGPEVRSYAEVQRGYRYFQEGDVLFAKITPCMENGKAAIARGLIDGIGFGSTEFHILRPRPSASAEWIWYFVRRKSFRVAAKAAFRGGVGQQRVPQEFLESYLLPLPPLEEQRRIVAYLDQVQQQVTALKHVQAETEVELQRLERAILDRAFRGEL